MTTNRTLLSSHIARVRTALEDHAAGHGPDPSPADLRVSPGGPDEELPALQVLWNAFELSPFERDVLLLCAGMELDAAFPSLCARASGDAYKPYPTFGLALAALPGPHWDALAPSAALRHHGLVEVEPGPSLVHARIWAPERVWQFLLGIEGSDRRIARHAMPLPPRGPLAPSHERLAREIAAAIAAGPRTGPASTVQLFGRERADQAAVAARAAELLGLGLLRIAGDTLPSSPEEIEQLGRLLRRDAILDAQAVLVDCHDLDASDAGRRSAVQRLVTSEGPLMLVSGRERRAPGHRPSVSFDIASPEPAEQQATWITSLGALLSRAPDAPLPPWVEPAAAALSAQFDLDAGAIQAAASRAAGALAAGPEPSEAACLDALRDACRAEARPHLEDLAQHIASSATWEDLVLPDPQREVLRDIELFARRRAVVEAWSATAGPGARGRGTSVLFSGPSGTGKTLAAEVLANRLRLDLHRVDLSAVVSKYIGETEKNLRRVFDAAERGSAVLLFDEADAVFGKRSLVKDSHDRYANVEVSYLLQRIETFRGLAILTTNMKSGIDEAFLRRIRFVVEFPFPDRPQREAIWRRAFPAAAPTAALDFARLAQLEASGASIKNIAVHAALLAADDPSGHDAGPVRMHHVRAAAAREYAKIQQPLTALETRGWTD